ncbi:hypothetical protein ABK040_000683 [Willaertia magna]
MKPTSCNFFKKSLSIIISKFKTNKSFRFTFYFILFLFIFINTIIFSYFSYRHYYYLKYKEKLKYEEYVNNCLNYKPPSTFLSSTLSINGGMEEKLTMNENDNKEIELIPTFINDNSINGNNNEIIVNNNEMVTITNEQINKFQKDQCNVMCHIYLPPIQPLQKKITL